MIRYFAGWPAESRHIPDEVLKQPDMARGTVEIPRSSIATPESNPAEASHPESTGVGYLGLASFIVPS